MKTNKLIIAALVVTTAFTACKKGTISSKRLDGSWKLTSGNGTTKSETQVKNGSITTSYVTNSTMTWNGSTLVQNIVSNGFSTTETSVYTSEFTFTKADDKFVSKTKMEYTNEADPNSYAYYESKTDCQDGNEAEDVVVKTVVTSDNTAEGLFTVLGGTGEIEKNSRILTETTKNTTTTTTSIKYFQGVSQMPITYTYNTKGECVLAESSTPTTTELNNDISDEGTIITVKESSKTEMTVTAKTVKTSSQGTYTTVSNVETTLMYTKQ